MAYEDDEQFSPYNNPGPGVTAGSFVVDPQQLAQLVMAARAAQQVVQGAGGALPSATTPSPVLGLTDPFAAGAGPQSSVAPPQPDPAKAAALQQMRQAQANPQAAQTTAQPKPGGWVASGDNKDPYTWVDQCGEGQTCFESIAAVAGKDVIGYGSNNAQDKTTYKANKSGMIDVRNLSDHHNSNYDVADGQAHPEEYLDASRAAALFNVSVQYADKYADDGPLVFTAGSSETGEPATDASGNYVHTSHWNGANIDMRYMGSNGKALQGDTAYSGADVDRNTFIMDAFGKQNANLGATLTGDPDKFGLDPIDASLQAIHRNHMHFQNTYPKPPKPKR